MYASRGWENPPPLPGCGFVPFTLERFAPMSGKTVRSISIDEDLDEWLSQPEVNASGLVNDLVLAYRSGEGTTRDIASALRLREVEREIEDVEGRISRLKNDVSELRAERDRLQDSLKERETAVEDVVEDLAQKFGAGVERDKSGRAVDFPRENLKADFPPIQSAAAKVGIPAAELVEHIEDRLGGAD